MRQLWSLFEPVLIVVIFALPSSAQPLPSLPAPTPPQVRQIPSAQPLLIVPRTDFAFWNRDPVRLNNNCYNYATNRETDGFAQPGQASNRRYTEFTCAAVLAAASADIGLERTAPFPLASSDHEALIALVVAPYSDFHWYRRDSSGFWTHKPGSWPATNLDNSGNVITSPETADRGDYTDFCGYFKVKDYAYEADLQNGGYVRIGQMVNLPGLPAASGPALSFIAAAPLAQDQSEVELLMYSGRPNPRVSLREALEDEKIGKMLKVSSTQIAGIVQSSMVGTAVAPRLGMGGIAIHDREGLLFSQGSEIYLPTTGDASAIDETHAGSIGNALQNYISDRQK